MTVKGKAEPSPFLRAPGPRRRRPRQAARRYDLPIVGRRPELDALGDGLARARARDADRWSGSRPRPASGSRVSSPSSSTRPCARMSSSPSASVRRSARTRATGSGSEIWRTLFGLDDALDEDEQRRAVERALEQIDPRLVPRAPLLARGSRHLDSRATSSRAVSTPELRKTSLEALLADALRGLASEPLVLVLEDCHWIDALSRDLLEVLARGCSGASGAHRAGVPTRRRRSAAVSGSSELPHFSELELSELESDEAEQLIRMRLEPVLGDAAQTAVRSSSS